MAAAAVHLDSVYVFGGRNDENILNSVEQYNFIADSWTVLPAKLTVARDQLAAAYLDESIYLFGGLNNNYEKEAGTACECFNLKKLQLTVLQPLQEQLYSMAAASVVVTAKQVIYCV